MADDYVPRPDARFRAWQSDFVTHVNGHLADSGLAAGMMEPEIWGRVAWASRPRSCDPSPTPFHPIGRTRKRKVEKKRGNYYSEQ